jgi:hypothetical protein
MSHEYHEKPRRILGDDCEECVGRAQTIERLRFLDDGRLHKLADLAAEVRADPYGEDTPQASFGASHADMKAVGNLRLAARIVYKSGITEEIAQ